jgi:hypothetical protein
MTWYNHLRFRISRLRRPDCSWPSYEIRVGSIAKRIRR